MRRVVGLAALLLSTSALAQGVGGSSSVSAPTTLTAPTTVVGSLPTCNASTRGQMYIVTDSLLPVALATVAAGGAVVTKVFCSGVAWIVG